MRFFLPILFSLAGFTASAQVFMRPVDNAAAMALGGASVAYPGTGLGMSNEAITGLGEKRGIFASSALPFGIPDWQTARFQAFTRLDANSGLGLDAVHSGIEAYSEQSLNLVYGRKLAAKLFLGGGVSLMRVSAKEYGAQNNATFSLGFLAHALPKIWIGARVFNPVQQTVARNTLPTVLRIGGAWKPSDLVVLLAEMEKDLERPTQLKAGLEYRPVAPLVLRAGVRSGRAGRVAFGAGFQLKNGLSLHAATEWHPILGFTPAAMLAWR